MRLRRRRVAPTKRSILTAITAWGLLILGACGLPSDEQAREIDEPPPDLMETLPASSTTVAANGPNLITLRLYWHTDADDMVIVSRSYPEVPSFSEALDELANGPSPEEQEIDPSTFLRPAFSESLQPSPAGISEDIATIRVADEAAFRAEEDRRFAVSELVCTAVQFRNIDAVVLIDSEGEIPLTDIDANPIAGAATADHYNGCKMSGQAAVETAEANTN